MKFHVSKDENSSPNEFRLKYEYTEDELRKFIHDLRGAIRTFQFLAKKDIENTPGVDAVERKKQIISNYSEALNTTLKLLEQFN